MTPGLKASLSLLLPNQKFQIVPSIPMSTYTSLKGTRIFQPCHGPQWKQDWAQQLMTPEQKNQVPCNTNALKKPRSLMAFSPGSKGHPVL